MKIVIVLLLLLVLTELFALLWLKYTVGNYKNFWSKKAQASGELTYLALGDSAAQGIGASSPMRGYAGLIAKRLEAKTGKTVRIVNLSVSGATVRDCIRDQIPQIKDLKPDLVTIEIGANDVRPKDKTQFQNDYAELLPLLPDGTFVSNLPLFNSRPRLMQTAKDYSASIEKALKDYPKLHFVDLQKQTSEHQSIFGFAPDIFHPNNFSYKNWADAFWLQLGQIVD